MFKRALAINEKAFGPVHQDVALSLNNLAALYDTQTQYAQAKPLYLRALAIREQTLGAEHLDTAQTLNNLGLLAAAQGEYSTSTYSCSTRALSVGRSTNESAYGALLTQVNAIVRMATWRNNRMGSS